jgi:hypothetical protein
MSETSTYRAVLSGGMQSAHQIGSSFQATADEAPARLSELLAQNWQEPGALVRLQRAGDGGWEDTGIEVAVDD